MYTTTNRVTPIKRGPTPPPPLDPSVTTRWQTCIAPAPGSSMSRLSETERIERDLEADTLLAAGASAIVIADAERRTADYRARTAAVYRRIEEIYRERTVAVKKRIRDLLDSAYRRQRASYAATGSSPRDLARPYRQQRKLSR